MIEIKARAIGEEMEFSCRIEGKGADIIEEAVEITTQFPERLVEMDPALYKLFAERFADRVHQIIEEDDEHDRVN